MASSQTSGTCPSGHGMGTRSKSRKRERESQGQRKTAKGKKSTLYTTSVDDESAGAVGDEELSSVASSQTSGTCSTGHGMDTRLKPPKRERENERRTRRQKKLRVRQDFSSTLLLDASEWKMHNVVVNQLELIINICPARKRKDRESE